MLRQIGKTPNMSKKTILKERYEVQRRLGKGAMGEVYLAMDLKTNEPVAIKTISEQLYTQQKIRERFSREVVAMRKLNHVNIISYVDAFTVGPRACLVMEYVGGGTLTELIEGRSPLDDGLFKRLANDIIEAIAFAHDAGIIHRDLKPGNILLSASQQPKIADFGLARLTEFSTMTATGTALGTLAYMPPEAFDPLTRGDYRIDIWSLGVIFFEMLTGQLPFPGKTQPQMIGAILNDEPFALTSYRRDLPVAWDLMITRCLQKSPADRYQDTRELLEDLNEVPRSRQGLEGASGYEYRFLEFESTPQEPNQQPVVEARAAPKNLSQKLEALEQRPATPRPVRSSLEHADAPDFAPRHDPKTEVPIAAMLFGGALLWLGVLASLFGGLGTVLSFTNEAETLNLEPETAQLIVIVGALLFAMGLAFEGLFIDTAHWFDMFVMLISVGVIWAVFFSDLLIEGGLLTSLMGTMFYLVILMYYFQVKRA